MKMNDQWMMKKREICICLSLFTANSIKQQEYGEKKLEWNHLTAVIDCKIS